VQRFEYKVISLRDGGYTSTLNEYGSAGWELVSVVDDPAAGAPEKPKRGGLPMPRAFEAIEGAAERIGQATEPERTSTLLWVLRRPLEDD
jgi:uncharacterized protein DUF4177